MNKVLYFLICLFISVSITAETVYKKTNPDGSVTFTDQPSKETEEVKIRKPTTFAPTQLPSLSLPTKKLSPSYHYEINISQPANDSTIVGQHNVTVIVVTQPALQLGFGHKVHFQLDGESIISPSASAEFKNVSRGTHNLSVHIVDQNNQIISPIASNIFHMKRFFKKSKP